MNEIIEMSDAEIMARLVLIFHKPIPISKLERELWHRSTGTYEVTNKALCDFARKLLRAEEEPDRG